MITIENVQDLEDVKTPEETQEKLKGSYIVPGNLNEYLDQICQRYQNADLVQIMRYLPQTRPSLLRLAPAVPATASSWLLVCSIPTRRFSSSFRPFPSRPNGSSLAMPSSKPTWLSIRIATLPTWPTLAECFSACSVSTTGDFGR